ncbi:MAG: ABC transporter permease [Candidatus Hydrothermarchaeaceae archaeon]
MMDYLLLSLKNLTYHKARAALTLLGVVIGITAVVSMISIGSGMTASLEEQLEVLGSDKIIVTSTYSFGAKGAALTERDSDALEDIPGVHFSSPLLSFSSPTEFKGAEKLGTIWGLDPAKAERTFAGVSGYDLMRGRWLQKGDRNKIVIGYNIHHDFYDREVGVGNTIKIKGETFSIVGVFVKTGDRDSDNAIYGDIDRMREISGLEGDTISGSIVRVKEGYDTVRVGKAIEALLEKRHGEEDFAVLTPQQIVEQVSQAFRAVQVVFGGIAAVSFLVGGIGIANTMLMNVMERTREIGVMKATGATSLVVVKVFLTEAGVIGTVGGVIGILMGYAISVGINFAADTYLGEGVLHTAVTPWIALLAMAFSFIIGLLSGIYPAYRASNLDPVEALRG